MGFEITQGAVFYIVMMLIVILLGIGLVTGFKIPSADKIKSWTETFQPGQLYLTNGEDIQQFTKIDCSENAYILTLDGPKFATKKSPGENTNSYKFITILDYNGLLFVGQLPNEETEISCAPNGDLFVCPDHLKLDFRLRGIGAPTGTQTFHFTTWESNPAIKNALGPEMTLDKLLDDYVHYYISSFDVTTDVNAQCKRDFCTDIQSSITCSENNENGCYWDSGWITSNGCRLCPDYTECAEYSGAQCTQCPIAKANCKPGTLWGCEAI